jgi:hypothetical protein
MVTGKLPDLAGAGAVAALLVLAGGLPAQAQLVQSNPRINNGQIMIDPLLCQTDYQIRRAIAARGFTSIFLNAPVDNHIRVRATKGDVVYLIDYDYCLDPGIVSLTPLRSTR